MFLNYAFVITRFGLKWQRFKEGNSGKKRDNVMHLHFRICTNFSCMRGYKRVV